MNETINNFENTENQNNKTEVKEYSDTEITTYQNKKEAINKAEANDPDNFQSDAEYMAKIYELQTTDTVRENVNNNEEKVASNKGVRTKPIHTIGDLIDRLI